MHSHTGWVVVLLLAACGDDGPVNKLPDAPIVPDAPIDAARVCITPTGPGVVHSSNLATAEIWTEANSPHVIMFDTTVAASITIEPCAVVRIAGGVTVTIRGGGTFSANGQSGVPVTIERLTAATAFGPIRALAGSLVLTHTNIKGGGNPLGNPTVSAAIHVQQSTVSSSVFRMDHVDIAGSGSQGVLLQGVTGFAAGSQMLTIHGAAGYPIMSSPNLLGTIPTGTYTGNAIDEIMIDDSGGQITTSQTLHDRGIPYRVGDEANSQLDVVSFTGAVPVLTIEPGVVLKFHPGGRLRIDTSGGALSPAKGALIAVGTTAKPIVFTSVAATPAAGDWLGIWFSGTTDPVTRIQHARVEYAGGASISGSNSCPYPGRIGQNDAAIRIFGTTAPATQYITDTTVVSSALDGIDRGWRDNPQTDFLAGNTFTNVPGCKQSFPRTLAGACPAVAPPPCP